MQTTPTMEAPLTMKENLYKVVFEQCPIPEDVLYFIYLNEHTNMQVKLADDGTTLALPEEQREVLSGLLHELVTDSRIYKDKDNHFVATAYEGIREVKLPEYYLNYPNVA